MIEALKRAPLFLLVDFRSDDGPGRPCDGGVIVKSQTTGIAEEFA